MGYPQGINFRSTLGFVTDVSPDEFEGSVAADYPRTTARGVTVGWEQAIVAEIDAIAGNDARLAGNALCNAAATKDFRFDLAATGAHNIRFSAGDASNARASLFDLYDSGSLLAALTTGVTSAAQRFKDATDTEYTEVTWPGSNTAKNVTFTTTICRFRSQITASGNSLTHAYVEAVGGAVAEGIPWIAAQSGHTFRPTTRMG